VLYSLIGIVFLSVTLGFIQDYIVDKPHILEGKFGYWTNQLLNAQIGKYGVGGVLIFAYLNALVLIYNLDLKFSLFSQRGDSLDTKTVDDEEDLEEDDGSRNEDLVIDVANPLRAGEGNKLTNAPREAPQVEEDLTPEQVSTRIEFDVASPSKAVENA